MARRYEPLRFRIRQLASRLPAEQQPDRGPQVPPGHLDPEPFAPVRALAQPRRVHQAKWEAQDDGVRLDRVARRPWNLRYDRALVAEQRVEERRLSGVGRARDHEQGSLPQPLALGRGRHQPGDPIAHRAPGALHPLPADGALVLFREVDLVGDQRLELEELGAQRFEAAGEAALEVLERLTALRG